MSAVFPVALAQVVCSLLGAGVLAMVLVAWAVVVPLLGLALQGAVLVLLFAPATNAWFAGR